MPELELGASFSLHRCSELGLDKKAVLRAALEDLGLRRFRLMSYWNIHEQRQGEYDFEELDWQLDMIAKYSGKVTLAVGKRQPRWPECHIPDWALALPKEAWYEALYAYLEVVINRYKHHPALHSWQLENEALLKSFGYCRDNDYNRTRLRQEAALIKRLDPDHPLIMTLSDSWGLPWRRPRPDQYAMSLYRATANKRKAIKQSIRPALFYRTRAWLIRLIFRRPAFIHELQAEPWTGSGITKASLDEQFLTMNADRLKANVGFAARTGMNPIDLWGLEWWFWLKEVHSQPELWNTVKQLASETASGLATARDG